MPNKLLQYEKELFAQGYKFIAGVDEAGRGPMAGPVVAAAVIFEKGTIIEGINDSKKLTAKKREQLYYEIRKKALAYAVGICTSQRIDKINILQATFESMRKAVSKLSVKPDYIIIDGRDEPFDTKEQKHIIKGDAKSQTIAAASIIAKVLRDKLMYSYHKQYPEYGFNKHKGYGTKDHLETIRKIGRSEIHRKTFLMKEEKSQQLFFDF